MEAKLTVHHAKATAEVTASKVVIKEDNKVVLEFEADIHVKRALSGALHYYLSIYDKEQEAKDDKDI